MARTRQSMLITTPINTCIYLIDEILISDYSGTNECQITCCEKTVLAAILLLLIVSEGGEDGREGRGQG